MTKFAKLSQFAREVARGLASRAGYDFNFVRKGVSDLFIYDQVEYFLNSNSFTLYADTLAHVGGTPTDNVFKRLRFCVLGQLVEQSARRFPDLDVAECGCWRGHSTRFTATILARNGFRGSMRVFDSFEGGLSEYTSMDKGLFTPPTPEAEQVRRAHFASNEEEVRKNLSDFPFVEFYPGWIPERFCQVSDRQFCFVNIDVDMYQPTIDSLEFLYPRLVDGGSVFLDDYGYSAFPGAARAVDEFFQRHPPTTFIRLGSGGAFAIK